MNPFLLTSLAARLQLSLSELPLPQRGAGVESEELGLPQVFIGDLPPATPDSLFPCVLVVPERGHEEQGEAEAAVALICSICNTETDDAEGAEMDLAVLVSAVAQSLAPCRHKPLDGRFRLVADRRGRLFSWRKSSLQPRPYMQATLMTHWRMKGLE